METVYIHRVISNKNGTFGVMIYDNKPICVTCEDPWAKNKRLISCVPEGEYKVTKHNGDKYKDVWILNNVPDRSYILIHSGNTIRDTQGCILVGEYFTDFDGLPGIANSLPTLNKLRKKLPKEFKIVIIDNQ